LKLNLTASFYPGGAFSARNSNYTPIAGTDDPWLFASGARGLRACEIPLLDQGDGAAAYRVRLAFCDPENDRPGQRVFDIKLQGKVVEKDFDIVAAAGGRDRAVIKEYPDIEVTDKLAIALVSRDPKPLIAQAPILQAVEIVRQRAIRLGCTVPDFLTSQSDSRQYAEIRLANLRETPFEGVLRIKAPRGFEVLPSEIPIKLAAGSRLVSTVNLLAAQDAPAGDYPLVVELVRPDGMAELTRTARIEHLGRRGRLVVDVREDAGVQAAYPDTNKGTATSMAVDGGMRKMADEAHALAYLKFRFQVPGRPARAVLRLTNAGNPSRDAGRVCLAEGGWSESSITYRHRPAVGTELGRLGNVVENQTVDCPLRIDLTGKTELSLVIDPTSTDGLEYLSRESGKPAQLVIEYEPGGSGERGASRAE
jgi:hypothetical protein